MKAKSFIIDEKIHSLIKILAINENKKVYQLVNEALEDLLKKYKEKENDGREI